jgi:hypothetical protein
MLLRSCAMLKELRESPSRRALMILPVAISYSLSTSDEGPPGISTWAVTRDSRIVRRSKRTVSSY